MRKNVQRKQRKTRFNLLVGVPVVRGFLSNGEPFNAIIDTGSEETLIDIAYVKKNKSCFVAEKTGLKIQFMGIMGSKNTPIVNLSSDIYFRSRNGKMFSVCMKDAVAYNMQFMRDNIKSKDIDIEIHAILGSKFLDMTSSKINYDTKELIFNICQTETTK